MRHKYALVLASLALVASCSDSGPGNGNGTMTFDYSGGISGHFNASGSIPLFDISSHAFAAGVRDDEQGTFQIMAVLPSTGGKYHMVVFSMPRLSPGSETVDLVNCSSTPDCAALAVIFDLDDETGDTGQICGLETGTLILSTISENRATGSFSGSGTCVDSQNGESEFVVSAGSFNVSVTNANQF